MASTVRKSFGLHHANPRAVLRSKLTTDLANTSRPSAQVVGGMSPEARAAMLLTREDTKDSMSRSRHTSLPRTSTNLSSVNRNKNTPSSTNIRKLGTFAAEPPARAALKPPAASDSGSSERPKPAASTSDFNDSGFSSMRRHPLSGAATNTIIDADDKYEIDSNNNGSINTNSGRRRQHRAVSRVSRKHTISRRENRLNDNDDYDNEDSLDNGLSPGRPNTNANFSAVEERDNGCDVGEDDAKTDKHLDKTAPKSFVMALDAALEANCISRLRGDITDQTESYGASPGTVRALNGGRLSNAQEVVVNVCHGDCEKELVFHDDDDDSLDTARAASEIRVNTWLEYNQGFPPDEEDFGYDEEAENYVDLRPNTAALQTTKTTKTTLKVPTARVRSGVKQMSNTPPISSSREGKPPVANRRDNNNNNNNRKPTTPAAKNNSAGSARSKSGTAASQRDNSSSRFGSALSNDGSSKRSANSSATKRESFLTRKAKA